MKKRIYCDYYIGIDAGTDSVGWAVTDEYYNILKFRDKTMWGIRLFDEANPAAERRTHRTQRRRYGRRAQRTKLLQELFAEEITKKDPGFFLRMKESKYLPEDRKYDFKYLLFNDDNYTDGDFHKDYPTAYRLRKAFLDGKNISDPRLLYLAVHHIIINRGHFLFDGVNVENVTKFETVFNSLVEYINDNFDSESDIKKITDVDTAKFSEILKSKNTVTAKKEALYELFGVKKGQLKAVCDLLTGSSSVKLSDLFDNETLNSAENIKIIFSDSSYRDNHDIYEEVLEDKVEFTDYLKAVYDWSVLADILGEHEYISEVKDSEYKQYGEDLKKLKRAVKKYCPDRMNSFFNSPDNGRNYCAYAGSCNTGGKKYSRLKWKKKDNEKKKTVQECFYKVVKEMLNEHLDDEDVKYIFDRIADGSFLIKLRTSKNCIFPYQLNELELRKILKNAENNFPFLKEKDESGLTVSDKIMKLLTFRIPYYVGPLNDEHKGKNSNCWMVRRDNSKDRITPWNFENKVDIEQSAQEFIFRMTNKCTYLYGEDVLPKNSLLYSEYEVLNELNNLSLNGERLNVEDKKDIIEKVFKQKNKVKIKDIVNYYRSVGKEVSAEDFSGLSDMKEFKSSLKSYRDFDKILGGRFNYNYAEEAILAVLLFSGDKKILTSRLEKIGGGYFTDDEIKKISSLRYSDWGRFSKKLLTGVYSAYSQTGEYMNIITAMRETTCNFMETQGQNFGFKDEIQKINSEVMPKINEFSYDALVKDLYVSPKIKRSVWQTLLIVREIVKITGHEPKKIFIEMARGTDGTSKTPDSRKNRLSELYKKCGEDSEVLYDSLAKHTDSDLRKTALYLYYTQMGKCMYSGEDIELDNLFDKNIYDIDHIYPQSKTKDDSLDNKVLVKKKLNLDKSDKFPIPSHIITDKARENWIACKNAGLISKEKYERLTRKTELTADELAGFINRQLVETRQSTKAVAEILTEMLPDTAIVYAKASNADVFKKYFDIPKVREVNDYHHARDAYVNIVVGNVFDVKFTRNTVRFIKSGKQYSLNECMYDFPVGNKDNPAWIPGDDGTISTVKKVCSRENILYTRMPYTQGGTLYDVQLLKKGKGQFPAKPGDCHFDGQTNEEIINKYGGYNKIKGAYFCLVEHTDKKNKRVRSIEYVPVYLADSIEKNPSLLEKYVSETLGLKDADVRIRRIKMDSLFSYNGFLMNLSGRTGSQLIFKPAVQLRLNMGYYKYLKNIVKFHDRQRIMKNTLTVSDFDDITKDKNLELYDVLLSRIKDGVYGIVYSTPLKLLTEKREKFIFLSVESQAELLYNELHLFQCNRVNSDLSLLNGSANSGIIRIQKVISNKDIIFLINQSPTGLFENKINLKTI